MLIGPWARIDLAALKHNLQVARRQAPNSKIWAIVKADAYGHGLVPVAAALSEADGFGVARVSEALRLRTAGIQQPILVLAGALNREELAAAQHHGLELVVHQDLQCTLLAQANPRKKLRIWLKVDTGMHRLGFAPEQVPEKLARLETLPAVAAIGLMTHLANADDPEDPRTVLQCQRLHALAESYPHPLSIGNSGGILAFPQSRTQWVRPGILLYGASPFRNRSAQACGLRPVMHFQTRLLAIRRQRRGDPIGYGGRYRCPEDMPIGIAAVGYGDGYPRHAPDGTPVLVGDQRAALIGQVSMDSIALDLRGVQAELGAVVTLWGQGLPVEEIAVRAGTLSYALFCALTPRVHRNYQSVEKSDLSLAFR